MRAFPLSRHYRYNSKPYCAETNGDSCELRTPTRSLCQHRQVGRQQSRDFALHLRPELGCEQTPTSGSALHCAVTGWESGAYAKQQGEVIPRQMGHAYVRLEALSCEEIGAGFLDSDRESVRETLGWLGVKQTQMTCRNWQRIVTARRIGGQHAGEALRRTELGQGLRRAAVPVRDQRACP